MSRAAGSAGRDFLERIRTAVDVLRLRAGAVDAALADEGGFAPAMTIVALAGVAEAAGTAAPLAVAAGLVIVQLLASLLLAAVVHLGARLTIDPRADFIRFYRAFGYTYLAVWLTGIPIVHALFGWGLWLWHIAAAVYVAERCYRVERVRAVLLVGLPVAAGLVLTLLFHGVVAMAALLGGPLF